MTKTSQTTESLDEATWMFGPVTLAEVEKAYQVPLTSMIEGSGKSVWMTGPDPYGLKNGSAVMTQAEQTNDASFASWQGRIVRAGGVDINNSVTIGEDSG